MFFLKHCVKYYFYSNWYVILCSRSMLAEATQNTTRPTDYDDVKVTVTTSSTVITPTGSMARSTPPHSCLLYYRSLGLSLQYLRPCRLWKTGNFRRPSSLCIINLAVGQCEPVLCGASAAEPWYLHVRSYSIRCCRIRFYM
jgi:hypothetical protein